MYRLLVDIYEGESFTELVDKNTILLTRIAAGKILDCLTELDTY